MCGKEKAKRGETRGWDQEGVSNDDYSDIDLNDNNERNIYANM